MSKPTLIQDANRKSWNAATRVHNAHKRDQESFLKGGGSTLFPEEVRLLGSLSGLRLAHLQCNAGQDTLSLAALGADVVGVDLSDEAIATARDLATQTGLPARFVRSDIYDWLESEDAEPGSMDRVFCSYGALLWLPDLKRWAQGIHRLLKPGGLLVVMEFHPSIMALDDTLRVAYPSLGGAPLKWEEGVSDYLADTPELAPSGYRDTDVAFENPHPCYEFAWGIGDLLGALLAADLHITHFEEFAYSNGYRAFPCLERQSGRRFGWPEGAGTLPMMFGLVARR